MVVRLNMADPSNSDASPYAGLAARIRGGKKTAAAAEYEQRPPSLRIIYRHSVARLRRFRLADFARAAAELYVTVHLKVELDGTVVGTLVPGETLELDTTAGEHRLRIVGVAASSRTRILQLTNGQRMTFWCKPSFTSIIFEREH